MRPTLGAMLIAVSLPACDIPSAPSTGRGVGYVGPVVTDPTGGDLPVHVGGAFSLSVVPPDRYCFDRMSFGFDQEIALTDFQCRPGRCSLLSDEAARDQGRQMILELEGVQSVRVQVHGVRPGFATIVIHAYREAEQGSAPGTCGYSVGAASITVLPAV